ncbi:hypothetical protein ABZ916_44300 [Streptomyces sp. NPDC046853]|uniref:cytochrome P450 n=1 Tax=Streptomyces sp. NPDC046853 TaxID=3154920 RepID=UPI0033E745FC
MRQAVSWVDEGGYWLVDAPEASRHALTEAAFGSATLGPSFDLFVSERTKKECDYLLDVLRRWFVDHDPPEHTAERRACRPRMTRAFLRRLEPDVTRAVIEVLDRLPGEVEAMRDIAHPVAAEVIGPALGLKGAKPEDLRRWSVDIARFVGAVYRPDHALAAERSVREMAQFVEAALPADSVHGHRGSPDGSLREDVAARTMMLFGGLETSARLLGSLLHAAVTAETEPVDDALLVESTLRRFPPIKLVARIARHDTEFYGARIKAHQLVLISLRSAPSPAAPLLAFGAGRHLCLGAGLATLEARVFLREFRARYPHARLSAPGGTAETSTNALYSGFEKLFLTLRP